MDYKLHIHCCRLEHIALHWNEANLFGTCWRLYYNTESGGRIIIQDEITELGPDKIYLLPPSLAFSTEVTGDPKQFYVHFDVSEPYHRVRGKLYALDLDEELKLILNRALDEVLPPPVFMTDPGTLYASALASLALARVPADCLRVEPVDRRILNSIDRFEQLLSSQINIQEEAKLQGMSSAAFIRLFKQETNLTPYAYLTQIRVNRACKLLKKTELSLDQISEDTGFSDRFHFSKVFKHYIGIPPASFRKREVPNPFAHVRLPTTAKKHKSDWKD